MAASKLNTELDERRILVLLFTGTLVLMMVLLYATYKNMVAYQQNVGAIQEYNDTANEIGDLLTQLSDQESSIRGYLITQDSLFLEPYLNARQMIREQLGSEDPYGPRAPEIDGLIDLLERVNTLENKWDDILDKRRYNLREGQTDYKWLYETRSDMDTIRAEHASIMFDVKARRKVLLTGKTEGVFDTPIMVALYSLFTILALVLLFGRLNFVLKAMAKVKANLRKNIAELNEEVDVRKSTQALLQKVLDSSPSGIMYLKSVRDENNILNNFEYLSSNNSANKFVGRGDIVGTKLLDVFPDHEHNGLLQEYVRVVEEQVQFNKEFFYEGDGLNKWLSIHAVPMDNGFLVVFNDITENKRAQAVMAETGKLDLTAQLTRTVAHEVRNPLTNIHLAVEQLQDEVPVTEDTEPFFSIINRNLERIGKLIREMLESSKKRELKLVKCVMGDIVRDAMANVKDRSDLKDIKCKSIVEHELPDFMADCELIHLAINNITVNAVEAMERGKGELVLQAKRSGEDMVLEIRDNGIGIEKEQIDRLFEPFYSSRSGGLGLGLTTTRSILNSHGIQLSVKSELGKGTTFFLRFPKNMFIN